VTLAEIDSALASYGAGLEAELSLLRQLHDHAVRQRDTAATGHPADAQLIVDERSRLLAGLLEIESHLRPLRDLIAGHRVLAATRPGFAGASALHLVAAGLVRDILGADEETLRALNELASARRQAVQALETGSATLAAYRRAITPLPSPSSLFDQRG
jgi:hypothetical protein